MKITETGSNYTVVEINDKLEILFSYKTPVAGYQRGIGVIAGYFKTDKKWSVTTSKHINKYLKGITAIRIMPQEQIDKLAS